MVVEVLTVKRHARRGVQLAVDVSTTAEPRPLRLPWQAPGARMHLIERRWSW